MRHVGDPSREGMQGSMEGRLNATCRRSMEGKHVGIHGGKT